MTRTRSPSLEPITPSPVRAVARPLLRMRWEALSYLHWAVAPETVAALLPTGLTPDVYEGRAFVGLVPFRMAGIRVGGRGPGLPWGSFPETNVRTYVRGPDGGRGVFFHSLDVPYLAPTLVARRGYRLPYAWSRMRLDRRGITQGYLAVRRWPGPAGARSRVLLDVGPRLGPATGTPLDEFLSARWSLYAPAPGGGLLRAHVDHPTWDLHAASVRHLDDELLVAAGYPPPEGPPVHVRFAGAVDVRVSAPRRLR